MITYQKQLPVKYQTEVCVVGGGPAGVAAAVTAARHGARVFLLESQGFFGGEATAALVPAFMPFTNGVDFLAGGIGREVYDACAEDPEALTGRNVGIKPEPLKRLYDDMVTAAGVDFLFFATVVDVVAREGRVEAVVVAAKSGLYAVSAEVFIDATGDGDLCALAGAPFALGDERGVTMPSTLCSLWVDIDWRSPKKPQASALERAFADGVFPVEDRHLPGIFKTGETTGGGNIGHVFEVDGTKEEDLTRGMLEGRRQLPRYARYYRDYLGGAFADAMPVITGSTLGVRESRRILGDYVMTAGDFESRASFEDEIGRFSYPIDIHIAAPTKEAYEAFHKEHTTMRYKDGESYGIPYRALLPRTLENAYVVGRCLSADKKMQSSIRVMPGCFITGQAAGAAAAFCAADKIAPRQVDIGALQDRLLAMGGFLPNRK